MLSPVPEITPVHPLKNEFLLRHKKFSSNLIRITVSAVNASQLIPFRGFLFLLLLHFGA
jgi:hypothetical protein